MSYIVSSQRLASWIEECENLVIIDVRADLYDENYGEEAYEQDHLPDARFLHLEKDLSGEVEEHGGNHPLPDLDSFAERLGEIGVSNDSTVVVYDNRSSMFAPRAWFLLRHVGLENVYVLDGGYEEWKEAGHSVTKEIPEIEQASFEARVNDAEIVAMEDVKNRPAHVTLIDSRARERYLGLEEPLYDRAGHIPGAVNYNWAHVLDENGRWKSEGELREHFKTLSKDELTIVSCGSGVSACANLLALRSIGYNNTKLYSGSFSDWISYEDNELETKDEN